MKGGIEIRVVKPSEDDKEDIIFKNKNTDELCLDEEIELYSEIIIDIYLSKEQKHEKRKYPSDS
jgi:hypothetical protein